MERPVSEKVLKNLNRVEGQVRGIAKMVEEDRYCIDVVTQIEAARAALARIESDLLRQHLGHCVHRAMNSKNASHELGVALLVVAVLLADVTEAVAELDPDLVNACGERPSWFCETSFSLTHNRMLAKAADWIVTRPLTALLVLVILGGRYLLRPVFRRLAAVEMPEVFTAAALLIVTGTALAMDAVGLSMSLGAFLAGVLLADSEYRHELQADIEPFKGLLLGLFFIAVGMSAKLSLVLAEPLKIVVAVAALIGVKALILYGIGRVSGLPADSSRSLAFALPQGGEFAFVLLGIAATAGIMAVDEKDLLIVIVTASMIATPPLYALVARFRDKRADAPVYDSIDVPEHEIILAGFGPFGQIVGRMLRVKKIPYTVLERDARQVDFVRQFGNTIFYSDAGRVEVLRAAKADKARFFVLAIADIEQSLRVAEVVRRHFPNLRIFACARDRNHAMRLMDLGITDIVRRAYASSLEITGDLLRALGESDQQVERELDRFRRFDQETLMKQHAIYRDEKALIQTAKDFSKELEQLFEADAAAAEKSVRVAETTAQKKRPREV